ncbi:MAG TPA: serine hydrolase, partial [Thermomicrobiales bacterium]|nr:serine hydrolase [Thermomicrobiales bacterium]
MRITRRALAGLIPAFFTRHAVAAGQISTPLPVSTLEQLGFDPGLADTMPPALDDFPAVTGVCIVRHGQIAYEHYRGGFDAGTFVNIRSVTKSVTSTLVGVALERGDLDHIDLTLGDLMPERIPDQADPAVSDITLRSFLTMTSGLWWDGHADWQMLLASDDWVANTLSQPIVAPQGEVFVYNTGGSHVIGVALATATGRPLEEYADEHLFEPLGISRGEWMRSPQGEVNGGSGLELIPSDMAKLGMLMVQVGGWDGVTILPEGFASDATSQQSDGESITGGSIGVAYGFQWWVTDATGYEAFFALGFGGQYVYVVPELDLEVVVAAGFEDGETPFLTS